jgi:putative undecaprenyl diphosphate synthase
LLTGLLTGRVDHIGENVRSGGFRASDDVDVDPERDGWVRVPEPGSDDVNGDAGEQTGNVVACSWPLGPLYWIAADQFIHDDRIMERLPEHRVQIGHGGDGERLPVTTSAGQQVSVYLGDGRRPDGLDRIRHVTIFVCSTENLQRRGDAEITFLMQVIEDVLVGGLARPEATWQVHIAGTLDVLPGSTARALKEATADQ